jgi:hypothetical protein
MKTITRKCPTCFRVFEYEVPDKQKHVICKHCMSTFIYERRYAYGVKDYETISF